MFRSLSPPFSVILEASNPQDIAPDISRKESMLMEFHEKLQELRKQKGLTQEELAQQLFVSRTAISKWESGRGYPNIDSLKAISAYFSISLDELLSSEAILTIAEEESRQKQQRVRTIVFGLLDCSAAMLFFLPFFGQRSGGTVQAVSLVSLTEVTLSIRLLYFAVACCLTVWGVLLLALQNCRAPLWLRAQHRVSFALSTIGILFFTLGLQPYPAVLMLVFVLIKALLSIKRA